jgi:hypothetical protein
VLISLAPGDLQPSAPFAVESAKLLRFSASQRHHAEKLQFKVETVGQSAKPAENTVYEYSKDGPRKAPGVLNSVSCRTAFPNTRSLERKRRNHRTVSDPSAGARFRTPRSLPVTTATGH